MNRNLIFSILLAGCSASPRLDHKNIRQWSYSLGQEYPNKKAVLAQYKKDAFELFYLAARHTNSMGDDTLLLVENLFKNFAFNVVLIESIPHSSGESPRWFVDEAKRGRTKDFIRGGESSLAAILAHEKGIPFFAGEPDHKDIYHGLKSRGYSHIDILGFYVVRQIPQWIRENENVDDLFDKQIPPFLSHYCKVFSIASCPTKNEVLSWYREKLGKELHVNVSNEETAPLSDSALFTNKISSEVGIIRDHFTLNLIEKMLRKYKKVAVIYGASHFITLRQSFDTAFGSSKSHTR